MLFGNGCKKPLVIGAQISEGRRLEHNSIGADRRVGFDRHLQPFNLGALGSGQGLSGNMYLYVALRESLTGQPVSRFQLLGGENLLFVRSRLGYFSRYDLNPASAAAADTATEADKIHAQLPRAFEQGLVGVAFTPPSNGFEVR